MIRKVLVIFGLGFGLSLTAGPVLAHHAFTAEYDRDKPIKLTGTIKKVEWMNPHIWFYVEVKDENGKATTWGFSGAPPGMLMRRGVTKDRLKLGEVVTVEGFRAKDGSNNGTGTNVTFQDGRKVFAGAAEDVQQK
jgi:hypothetical protein